MNRLTFGNMHNITYYLSYGNQSRRIPIWADIRNRAVTHGRDHIYLTVTPPPEGESVTELTPCVVVPLCHVTLSRSLDVTFLSSL